MVDVDRSECSESVILFKNGSDYPATFNGRKNDWLCLAEMVEDWCSGERPPKLLKCTSGLTCPFPCVSRLM